MKTIAFAFDEKEIDSLFIERIWRTHSTESGAFISQAVTNWEIVVTRFREQTTVTLIGPETRSSIADCPADAEFFGIQFKVGTYMPRLHPPKLVDGYINFAEVSNTRFWFDSTTWEIPSYENADIFVDRLVKADLLVRDSLVSAALNDQQLPVTKRTIQRRFRAVTGLTQGKIQQINRARRALRLLQNGVSIFDTAFQAGYADQAHLTRALKQFVGQTPGQILRQR